MSKKTVYGIFDDEETLLSSIKQIRDKVRIKNAITPFPVHGLDAAIGLKRTRIAITAFIYGGIGCSLALWMMWYMLISDWPMDIGGKPNTSLLINIPAFIPI